MPTLPDGIEDTAVDAALLVGALREVVRVVQRREKISDSPDIISLCREIRLLCTEQIATHGDRRGAWEAMKADLISAFRIEVVGVSDKPF